MKDKISMELLEEASDYITSKIGLFFPKERIKDLQRGIVSAAEEEGIDSIENYIRKLVANRLTTTQISHLAVHLTIGETYFFRDHKVFEVVKKNILCPLIEKRRQSGKTLRIWSAGCSSGEECYSIAILLKEMLPDFEEWNITILGTDINFKFLEKAKTAVYTEWSFRDTKPDFKEKYFNEVGKGLYELKNSIKKCVTFSMLNLAEDSYEYKIKDLEYNVQDMDIIFCRNVLIYFEPAIVKKIINKFYSILIQDGYLLVAPSEGLYFSDTLFTMMFSDNVFLYKKSTEKFDFQSLGYNKEEPNRFQIKTEVLADYSKESTIDIEIAEKNISFSQDVKERDDAKSEEFSYGKMVEAYDKGLYEEVIASIRSWYENIKEKAGYRYEIGQALSLLVRCYANQKNLAEALIWCSKAIEYNKLNPELYHLYASILQEEGKYKEAAVSLKKALYLDPNFILAYFALGNVNRNLGNIEEAKKDFNNALFLLGKLNQEEVLDDFAGMTVSALSKMILKIVNRGEVSGSGR